MARYPLNSVYVTGAFKEKAQPGTGLPDAAGVRRHIGTDLRASVGTAVYAIEAGTVTQSYSSSAGQTIEIKSLDGKRAWRYMHLSLRSVAVGQRVNEGDKIANSGNSGGVAAHLHVDVRIAGTTWNASLNNYSDPLATIDELNRKFALPAIGKRIQLLPPDKRTTFKAGTATQVGTINVTDNTFDYLVRGHDPKFPNRVIINSASAGGNGVSLALYYLNGNRIAGWKEL